MVVVGLEPCPPIEGLRLRLESPATGLPEEEFALNTLGVVGAGPGERETISAGGLGVAPGKLAIGSFSEAKMLCLRSDETDKRGCGALS